MSGSGGHGARAVLCLITWLALTTAPAAAVCSGDCNGDGEVTVADLIAAVNVSLGSAPLSSCAASDGDGNGEVSVAELIQAVSASLQGCPAETPTATSSPSSTASPNPTATPTGAGLDCAVSGVICTVAGTGQAQYDGDGRPALQTSLYFPIALQFDAQGRLLIMDWNNLRLRRIEPDGTIATIMGIGSEDFPTDGALAIDTPLHHANDMAFDTLGNLYIAGDHVPLVFLVDLEQRVRLVAGTQDYGYAGDGGPALEAQLETPIGVLPDGRGGVYIGDVDANVVRHVGDDGIISTVAGTGEKGYAGDGGPATAAQLAGPARLRFGPEGDLSFCETKNHIIRRLRADGSLSTVAGSGGRRGYSGDGGAATAALLDTPYDLRFAPNGDLYVADLGNNVIRRIDTAGVISTVVGDGQARYGGDGGPASVASLKRPSGILFDTAGSLWIADTANQRVRRVTGFLGPLAAAFERQPRPQDRRPAQKTP
ncbi:MAG: hypothetical protein ABI629_19010 [bacterium]